MRLCVLVVFIVLLWGCEDAGAPEPDNPSTAEAQLQPLPVPDESTASPDLVSWVDQNLVRLTAAAPKDPNDAPQITPQDHSGDAAGCARVVEQAGRARIGEADWDSVDWRTALDQARHRLDIPCVIEMYNVAGLSRSSRSDFQSAIDHYSNARFLAARIDDPQRWALAESAVGNATFFLGRFDDAIPTLERAIRWLDVVAPGDPDLAWHQATALLNLGRAQASLGRTDKAIRALMASVSIREALRSRSPPSIEAGELLFPAYRALGKALLDADRLTESEVFLRKAASVSSYSEFARANAFLGLAELKWKQGQLDQAWHLLETARGEVANSPALGVDLSIHMDFVEANLRKRLGDHTGALAAAERVVAHLEVQRAFANSELSAPFFSRRAYYSNLRLRLLLQAGLVQRAFDASESLRARGLLDSILWPMSRLTESASDSAIVSLERARSRLSALLREQASDESLLAARKALIQAESRIRRDASAMGAEPIEFAEAQSLFGPDDLLLGFSSTGDEAMGLWVLAGGRDHLRFVSLPPIADFTRSIVSLHQSIADGRRRAAEKELEALSSYILGPVVQEISETRHVVIVAEGIMGSVPFSALRVPGGRRLLRTHSVSQVQSLSVLAAIRSRRLGPREAPARDFAAVAGPSYLITADERPALPASTKAAVEISRLVRSQGGEALLILGPEATRERILGGALASSRRVHIGAHIELHPSVPDLSAIRLSETPPGDASSGALYLRDLRRLDLQAEVVTLAGCESGGELRRGAEGPMAFPRGFLHVGADAVVASLWPIHDQPTADLMVEFHRLLLQDRSNPADALRRAQIHLLDGAWPEARHWAGFVLFGDWLRASTRPEEPQRDEPQLSNRVCPDETRLKPRTAVDGHDPKLSKETP